jgi:acetyl esterase/lipase
VIPGTKTESSTERADADARIIRDLVFAEPAGFRPLTLDVYLPEGQLAAVVLFLHGGGWRGGSRRVFCPGVSRADSFDKLTSRGIAVVAADYRLSGEAHFPAQLDDAHSALEWLQGGGAEWGFDRVPVVVWGESAGAHLAALLGVSSGIRLAGVVDWYGPTDLVAFGLDLQPEDPDGWDADAETREALLLGGRVSERAPLAHAASPARQVEPGAPAFFIAHGLADSNVPFAQSQRLADALRRAGVPVTLLPVEDAGHMWRGVEDTGPLFELGITFTLQSAAARAVKADPGGTGSE